MAKRKSNKKLRTAFAVIALFVIIAFVALCYFHPPFLNYINGLLGIEDEDGDGGDIRVEGGIAYVTVLEDLKVHFVDVGQGDAIIIELPDGKNVIIDAGDKDSKDYSELKNYIDNQTGVKSFDYAIATHGDSDHIGSMDKILQYYEVKYVYRPHVLYTGSKYDFDDAFNQGGSKSAKDSNEYGDFLNAVKNETYTENGETKSAGWEFFTHKSDFAGKISYNEVLYEYYFDFLTPRVENFSDINYSNANDYSPIIKFSYCGVDILFTGDAEGGTAGDAEDDFVAYYKNATGYDLDVDILKVGHHGSETSTTQELLDIVKPEHAIIQCGVGNTYRHPRQATLNRLKAINSVVYRNDLHGDIVATLKADGTFTISKQVENLADMYTGGETLYA